MPGPDERDDQLETPAIDSERAAQRPVPTADAKNKAIGVGPPAIAAALIYAKRK